MLLLKCCRGKLTTASCRKQVPCMNSMWHIREGQADLFEHGGHPVMEVMSTWWMSLTPGMVLDRYVQRLNCEYFTPVHDSVADLESWKEGFQYAVKAGVGRLLGESWGMPPRKLLDFWHSEIVSSVFLRWNCKKVERPTAKPGCCVWSP